jgi:hypothetical protein
VNQKEMEKELWESLVSVVDVQNLDAIIPLYTDAEERRWTKAKLRVQDIILRKVL